MWEPVDGPTLVADNQSTTTAAVSTYPAVTILWHPDPDRVGAMFLMNDLGRGEAIGLSRSGPAFPYYAKTPLPLGDPFVSRKDCIEFAVGNRGLRVRPLGETLPLSLSGQALDKPRNLSDAELSQGAVLTLGRRLALCLHLAQLPKQPGDNLGLVGNSDVMNSLRASILSAADLATPVLIRGETGTGKELVAKAIVEHGTRRKRPFVAVNIGALPPQLAAAELFGHAKGAFTDARHERDGYFHEANGGTLFLDEIGLATPDVQAALLRVLETGELRRIGGHARDSVDVRLLSATDSDRIDRATGSDGFSQALFHRLSQVAIHVPALRQRPQDLGLLLLHFLREALAQTGETDKLQTPATDKRPWLSADVFMPMVGCSWPGNVRQLRNLATQIVVASRGERTARISGALFATLTGTPRIEASAEVAAQEPVDHEELVAALARHDFQPTRAARALGISRSTMYDHMRRDPNLGMLSRLTDAEFQRHVDDCNGDLRLVAERLRVSFRAAQLRYSKL